MYVRIQCGNGYGEIVDQVFTFPDGTPQKVLDDYAFRLTVYSVLPYNYFYEGDEEEIISSATILEMDPEDIIEEFGAIYNS